MSAVKKPSSSTRRVRPVRHARNDVGVDAIEQAMRDIGGRRPADVADESGDDGLASATITADDAGERRQANRAIAVSAVVTGFESVTRCRGESLALGHGVRRLCAYRLLPDSRRLPSGAVTASIPSGGDMAGRTNRLGTNASRPLVAPGRRVIRVGQGGSEPDWQPPARSAQHATTGSGHHAA